MGANQQSTNLYMPSDQGVRTGLPSSQVSQSVAVDASGLAQGVESLAKSFSDTRNALEEVNASQDLTLLQQDIKVRGGALELQLKQADQDGMVEVDGVRKPIADLTNEYNLKNDEAESAFRSKYNSVRLANYTTQSKAVVATAKTGGELLRMTAEHGVLVSNTLVKEEEVQQSYLKGITPASTPVQIENTVRQYKDHMKGLGILGLETTSKLEQDFGQMAILKFVESAKTDLIDEVDPEQRLIKLNALEKNLDGLSKSKVLLPYLDSISKLKLETMGDIGQEKRYIVEQKKREYETYLDANILQAQSAAEQAASSGYTPAVNTAIGSLKSLLTNRKLDPMQRQKLNSTLSELTLNAWGGEETKKLVLMGAGDQQQYAINEINALNPKDPYYLKKREVFEKVLKSDEPAVLPTTLAQSSKFVSENGIGRYIATMTQNGVRPRILYDEAAIARIKQNAQPNSINGYAIASDINGFVSSFVKNGVDQDTAEVGAYQEVADTLKRPWISALAHIDVSQRGKLLNQALSAPPLSPAMASEIKHLLLTHKGADGKPTALNRYANRLLQNGGGPAWSNLVVLAGRAYYSEVTMAKASSNPNFANPNSKDPNSENIKRATIHYYTGKNSSSDSLDQEDAFLNKFSEMLRPPLTPAVRGYDPRKPVVIPKKEMGSQLGLSFKSDVSYNQNTVAWLGGIPLPAKMKAVQIASAYRDPNKNKAVGGGDASDHKQGLAIDLAITRPDPYAIEGLVAYARSGRVGKIIVPPSFASYIPTIKKANPNVQVWTQADHSDHVHISASKEWQKNTRLLQNWAYIHPQNGGR